MGLACSGPTPAKGPFASPAGPTGSIGSIGAIPEDARMQAADRVPTYVLPNSRDEQGRPIYLHPSESDMPWVVSIGYPQRPPRYASTRAARETAIAAMRQWEERLSPHLPWFRLEFVEEAPDAPVQVTWKRRITGVWAGFGGLSGRRLPGSSQWWVGGHMEVSTTPSSFVTLELNELRDLFVHEFGHVLGLMHCHACDSAMNYEDRGRREMIVSDLDVRTFLELVTIPNGTLASEWAERGR